VLREQTYLNKSRWNWLDNRIDSIIKNKRDEIFNKIFKKNINKHHINLCEILNVLDVGTTAEAELQSSNVIAKKIPANIELTSCTDQHVSDEILGRPVFVVNGDAKNLGFKNDIFDLVISSAVIEHVGNIQNQIMMLRELVRVSRKWVVITTPNRRHPIEFHTQLPLIHWLPKKAHRVILKIMGQKFLSKEENLNLMNKNDINYVLKNLNINKSTYTLTSIRLLGFVSNWILIIRKN